MKTIYINGKFLAESMEGIQRFSLEVTKELTKYMKVILVCPKNAKEIIPNAEYIYLNKENGLSFEQIALPKYIKKNKINNLLNYSNFSCVKNPNSVVIHDTLVLDYPKSNSFKYRTMVRIINRLNIYRYKTIYTVSNYSKKRILNYYPKIKKDIIVLSSSAASWKNIEAKELKLPFDRDFYFSLSTNREYKNYKYILNLAKANPTRNFVCTGKKDKITVLDDIPNNVYFTGYLCDEEIKYLYQKCYAFIMPSLSEGFGLPPLEAIESGCKKIIVSDIEVFREIYFTGVNFIDISKTINLSELELHEITEEEKNKLTNKYTWENVAKRIEETWME